MIQLSEGKEKLMPKDREAAESHVAVPVDLQIELAENRRSLAEARYEISVRKGRAWGVPKTETEKNT